MANTNSVKNTKTRPGLLSHHSNSYRGGTREQANQLVQNWQAGMKAFLSYWAISERKRALLVFVLSFSLYLFTLAPTIYNLDSAELTTATVTGGLMRATGYPLYLFLGRIWALLPVGDMGYRMNLFSAFTGALTLLLVERILYRLKVNHWAIFIAVGLLATAPYFWSLSLIAEVYTLHTALMGIIILLLLRWGEQPSAKALAFITFAIGLSMGHHLATSLLVPGAIWYVFATHPRQALTPKAMSLALAGLLLGLSIYLVIPIRYLGNPEFNYAGTFDETGQFHPVNLATPAGLWWLITGQSFAAQMFAYQGVALLNETLWYLGHLTRAFFGVGIGLGVLGLIALWRENWRLSVMFILIFALSAFFYIDYQVVDKVTMFLPTYVVWAVWVGIGAERLIHWVRDGAAKATQQKSTRLVQWSMALTVLFALVYTGPKVNLSDDRSTRELGESILERVEPNAFVIGWWDTVPVIQYLQLVENRRPDVKTVNRFLISFDDLTSLVLHETQALRPVYIDEVPESWESKLEVQPAGFVYLLSELPGETENAAPGKTK